MLITFCISLNKDCGNDLPIRRTGATLAGLKWDFHRTPHMSAHVCAGAGEDTCGHGHKLTYCVQHKCKFTQLNKFEQIYIQSEHNMLSVIR